MTIRLSPFEDLNYAVGTRFPEADEEALWRCADAWRAAAAELRRLRPEAIAAGDRVLNALGGEPGATFDQFWRRFSAEGEGFIDRVAQACEVLAAACDETAREVEYAKIQYLLALLVLAATLVYLAALVWAGGVSAVGIPLAIAVAQFTIRTVLMRLVSAVAFGAALGVALDGVAQGIQIGLDHRDSWDWAKTRRAVEDGAIYGAATGGLFLAGGRVAPGVTNSLPGAFAGTFAAGGVGGLAAPLSHGETPTWNDFVMSTTSAMVGGFGRRPGRGVAPDLGHLGAIDVGPLTPPETGSLASLDPDAALAAPSLDDHAPLDTPPVDASTAMESAKLDPPATVDPPAPPRAAPPDESGPRAASDPLVPGPRAAPESDLGPTLAGDPPAVAPHSIAGSLTGQPGVADARVADPGTRPPSDTGTVPSNRPEGPAAPPPTRTDPLAPPPGVVASPGVIAGPGVATGATATPSAAAPTAGATAAGALTAGGTAASVPAPGATAAGAAPGVPAPAGHAAANPPAPSLALAAGATAPPAAPPTAAGETGSSSPHTAGSGSIVAGGLAGVGGPPLSGPSPGPVAGSDGPPAGAADARPDRVADGTGGDATAAGRLSLDEAVDVVRRNVLSTRAGLAFYAHGDEIRAFAQAVHPTDGFITLDLHGSSDGFRVDNHMLSPEQFATALRRLEADGVISLGDGLGIKLLSCDTAAGGPDSAAARLARALGVEVIAPDEAVWTTLAGDEIVASPVLVNGVWVPTHPPDGAWHHFDPRGNETLLDNLPVGDQTDAETRSRSHGETAQPRAPDGGDSGRPESSVDGADQPKIVGEGDAARLLNADQAVIHPDKIYAYALDPNNVVGRHKARVFEAALGYDQTNAGTLVDQLRTGAADRVPVPGKVDEYGERFALDIPVTGPKGSAVVRTGWIYDPGSVIPRLVTLMVR